MTAPQSCRPREHLAVAGRLYPQAWRQIDEFRAGRGVDLPMWPDWCFAPLAASYAIVSGDAGVQVLPPRLVGDVARLGALCAWRVTQGIYRFDPAVYDAVRETPLDREIPCDVLYLMPEWCVYIETPGLEWAGEPLYGVWAHLEWDAGTGRTELRLLTDSGLGLYPIVLHLGAWTLAEAIERAIGQAMKNATDVGGQMQALGKMLGSQGDLAGHLLPVVQPVVSMLLYICSQGAELGAGGEAPAMPQPKRVRGLLRLFAVDKPKVWDVGVRMGSALRRAYAADQIGAAGHAGPRAHIRRAHWHGFWRGPLKGARQFDLRWLPPIPVNVDDLNTLPATVRPVK